MSELNKNSQEVMRHLCGYETLKYVKPGKIVYTQKLAYDLYFVASNEPCGSLDTPVMRTEWGFKPVNKGGPYYDSRPHNVLLGFIMVMLFVIPLALAVGGTALSTWGGVWGCIGKIMTLLGLGGFLIIVAMGAWGP